MAFCIIFDELFSFLGTTIAVVQAMDPDNDIVTFSLGEDAKGRFKINKDTGELMLNTVLDREQNVCMNALMDGLRSYSATFFMGHGCCERPGGSQFL